MKTATPIAALGFVGALAVSMIAHAATNSFTETFTTTTYKDAVNTTADWNTAAGEFAPAVPASFAVAYNTGSGNILRHYRVRVGRRARYSTICPPRAFVSMGLVM